MVDDRESGLCRRGPSRKDFLITRDRTLGGIYRWTDAQAAEDRFDDTWYAEAEDRYGERPTVDGFEILEIW